VHQPDTERLLDRAAAGDAAARGALLIRHRDRLRRMLAVRLDPRLAARVDPSDVVQDTLAEADRRLDDYLHERPLPFYPWLRQLASDRLGAEYRRHVRAGRRSVGREVPPAELPEGSVVALADRLLDRGPGPSEAARREERREQVRRALAALPPPEREVLALRYLEELSAREVGAVLGVGEEAAKKRALRALRRLQELLEPRGTGGGP
jgi:RNA polymerase sigma-70 factor (ECF subfamily)